MARYFTDSGFEVVRDIYLQCRSWTAIAEVTPDLLREKLIELNGNGRDVDAIVQVGTNLSMVRLAAAAELWLGKPVIAINTATYWHALRQNGIADKISGLGRLLEDVLSLPTLLRRALLSVAKAFSDQSCGSKADRPLRPRPRCGRMIR